MRKIILAILIALFLGTNLLLAADTTKKAEKKTAPLVAKIDKEKQAKDELVADVNGLRIQEARVAVLLQLFNEEAAKLRSSQEDFCKKYKLDVEKFRQGLYRYDDAQNKFVERAPVAGEKK